MIFRRPTALVAMTLSLVLHGSLYAHRSLEPIADDQLQVARVPREVGVGILLTLIRSEPPLRRCDEYLVIWAMDRSGHASSDAVALACDEPEGDRLVREFSKKYFEVESVWLPFEVLLALGDAAMDADCDLGYYFEEDEHGNVIAETIIVFEVCY